MDDPKHPPGVLLAPDPPSTVRSGPPVVPAGILAGLILVFTWLPAAVYAGTTTVEADFLRLLNRVEAAVDAGRLPGVLGTWTRGQTARELARGGRVEAALKTLRGFSDTTARDHILRRVVDLLARIPNRSPNRWIGRLTGAEQTRVADRLVRHLAAAGHRREARRLAHRHTTPGRCLGEPLAEELVRHGAIGELRDVLPTLQPRACRGRTRAVLAEYYGRRNRPSRSDRLFEAAREELGPSVEDRAVLAYRLSRAGFRARAKTTFHEAYRRAKEIQADTDAARADRAFATIVEYQLRADLPGVTWSSLWMRGADTSAVLRAHLALARYLARTGPIDRAFEVADTLESIGAKSAALLAVAGVRLGKGDTKTARVIERELGDPKAAQRLQLLLLRHYARTGDPNRARTHLSKLEPKTPLYYRGLFWLERARAKRGNPVAGQRESTGSGPASWFRGLGQRAGRIGGEPCRGEIRD